MPLNLEKDKRMRKHVMIVCLMGNVLEETLQKQVSEEMVKVLTKY